MNKKIILFLIVFSIGVIFVYPAFPTSHTLDGYCTICNGYKETALSLLKNGKIFIGISYYLFNIFKIPFNSLGFISAFLSVLFLTIAIVKLYELLKNNIASDNYTFNILLLICIFLLYFTPLFTSVILLDESFIICLGILFLTLSSIYMFKKTKFNYIISLIFSILGVVCYPEVSSYLFVTLILIFLSSKKYRYEFKLLIKKISLAIVNYVIGVIINFSINKFICNMLNENLDINIFGDMKKTFTELILASVDLFNYVNIKYFYTLIIILFIITVICIFKNQNKAKNLFLILLLAISTILIPFITYRLLNFSKDNLTATMILTIGSIPSIIILYILFAFPMRNKKIYFLSSISLFLFLLTFFSIHQDTMIDLKRYKTDIKYVNNLIEKINYYENKNHIKIKNIYYAFDTNVDHYYNFGNNNEASIRIASMPKNLGCALKAICNREYKFTKMKNEDYLKYFKNKNYNELSDEQFILKNKNLYILIY